MITSEKLDKILPALAKVKSELGSVLKKANNPFFKSKYADLNTYLDEVEERLEKEGLLLLQPVESTGDLGQNVVSSRIFHVETGQFVESSMRLVGESDMQKAGSAVTYARRYTLGSLLAMKAEDDDGNTASNKTAKESQPAKLTPKTEPTVATAKPVNTASTTEKPSFRNKNKAAVAPAATTPAAVPAINMIPGDDL